MSYSDYFVLTVFIIWALWFNQVSNSEWKAVKPIERKKFPLHHTKGAFGGARLKNQRLYIIAGGSGFIGSWIVRYLLARGETNVFILDIERPAADLLKHGAFFIQVDLTHSLILERELTKLSELCNESTKVIVYNCCLIKRLGLPNFRADLGIHASEMLYVALRLFSFRQVVLIYVGDSLAHRQPIRNLDRVWPTPELWCQVSSSDLDTGFGPFAQTKEDRRERSFSSYAWHQLQAETMTLGVKSYNPSIAAAAVLRVEGYTSGHLGDGIFSPIFQRNSVYLHSSRAPITIVHIEDVARACLSIEYLLMDPETCDKVDERQFTIGSSEVTTMQHVFEYCKRRRPSLRIWKLPPALVFLLTILMSFIYIGKPKARKSLLETPLDMTISTLTLSRFYTLHVGQVPNPANEERQRKVLSLHNNFSLSQTLDGLIDEIELVEKKKLY